MKRFTIERLHRPTGDRSQGEIDALDQRQALATVNDFNRISASVMQAHWHYWIEPEHLNGREP